MTNSEIIKVLECCSSARTVDDCEKSGCPCSADPKTCVFADNQTIQRVIDVSLDLINRQKAEIERLKMECIDAKFTKYKAEFKEFKAEIEAEAIKQFAERLKYTLIINNEHNTVMFDYDFTLETIDNLAKEMVGDNNGKNRSD